MLLQVNNIFDRATQILTDAGFVVTQDEQGDGSVLNVCVPNTCEVYKNIHSLPIISLVDTGEMLTVQYANGDVLEYDVTYDELTKWEDDVQRITQKLQAAGQMGNLNPVYVSAIHLFQALSLAVPGRVFGLALPWTLLNELEGKNAKLTTYVTLSSPRFLVAYHEMLNVEYDWARAIVDSPVGIDSKPLTLPTDTKVLYTPVNEMLYAIYSEYHTMHEQLTSVVNVHVGKLDHSTFIDMFIGTLFQCINSEDEEVLTQNTGDVPC